MDGAVRVLGSSLAGQLFSDVDGCIALRASASCFGPQPSVSPVEGALQTRARHALHTPRSGLQRRRYPCAALVINLQRIRSGGSIARVVTDMPAEIVKEWEGRAAPRYGGHFSDARAYFTQTVAELASEEATWTISDHEGHAVLLLAGSTAFALLAFSGEAGGVTIKGALHPLDEGVIRVSFSDQPTENPAKPGGEESFAAMVRRWSFDWHGRLQLSIEYRVGPADQPILD